MRPSILPASVRVEYGGTYQQQQQSFSDLLRVLVLALALVFGVLLAEFRNFPAPVAILSSSVLSISGVIVALLVTRSTFNVASFMGLIMVIGIVAKNGILLLDADERYPRPGRFGPRCHAARRATPPAADRDDRDRGGLRHVAAGLCPRRRFADAAAAGHRRHRRAHASPWCSPWSSPRWSTFCSRATARNRRKNRRRCKAAKQIRRMTMKKSSGNSGHPPFSLSRPRLAP